MLRSRARGLHAIDPLAVNVYAHRNRHACGDADRNVDRYARCGAPGETITCDTIRAPQMEADARSWNQASTPQDPRVLAQNSVKEGNLRPKTHESGGVDCVYGVVNGTDPIEYGASAITPEQRQGIEAELEKQHFEKRTEGNYRVYSGDIPMEGKKEPQPISFAFDDERGMWFWATVQKEYAVLMANAYRG